MKIRQLSLFLENRPGHLRVPLEALGAAGIDVLGMTLADTRQFGILRLVVKDPERARQVLEAAGSVVKVTDVLAIDVPDLPGGLAGVLATFEGLGLGIEYMYAASGAGERAGFATLLVRVADPDAAIPALQAAGVELVPSDELFRRARA